MNIEMRSLDTIYEYAGNARDNEETVKALKKAIRKYGFNQPIVVDGRGIIVKGHSRFKAALELGLDKIPVIISEKSDEINRADRLADNMIHDLTDWDEDALRAEVRDIQDPINEILGEEFSTSTEYRPAAAGKEVTNGAVQSARDKMTGKIASRAVMLKYTCPECHETIFIDKKAVERL